VCSFLQLYGKIFRSELPAQVIRSPTRVVTRCILPDGIRPLNTDSRSAPSRATCCTAIVILTRELASELYGMNMARSPHEVQNSTNVEVRISGPRGMPGELSLRSVKRVEGSFGWMKMVGMLRKVKLPGIDTVE
jgi:hypothetical protein